MYDKNFHCYTLVETIYNSRLFYGILIQNMATNTRVKWIRIFFFFINVWRQTIYCSHLWCAVIVTLLTRTCKPIYFYDLNVLPNINRDNRITGMSCYISKNHVHAAAFTLKERQSVSSDLYSDFLYGFRSILV